MAEEILNNQRPLRIEGRNGGIRTLARDKASAFGREALIAAAAAGRSGSLGAGFRTAADRATRESVYRGAERTVARIKRRQGLQNIKQEASKKLTGAGFYMVLGLTLIKDFSDILMDLSVLLSIATTLTGIVVSFVVAFYLFYNDVKPTTRKVVTYVISLAVESIPFVSFLPMAAVNLLLIRFFENNDLTSVAGKLPGPLGSIGKKALKKFA